MWSSARDWMRRHRRVVLVAGVGGTAVAAYYAYKKLQPLIGEMKEGLAMIRNLEEQMSEEEARSKQARLEKGLELNMNACRLTTKTMSVEIRRKAEEIFEIDSIRQKLKKGKREARDFDLLESFKIAVLSRSITSYYAICLADAFVKTQISIIGRHTYLPMETESNTPSNSHDTEETNKIFLQISHHISSEALPMIAAKVKEVVADNTKLLNVQNTVTIDEFHSALSSIRRTLDNCLIHDCVSFLFPDGCEGLAGPGNLYFNEMLAEAGSLLRSSSFRRVVCGSVDIAFRTLEPLDQLFQMQDEGAETASVRFGKLLPKFARIFESEVPLLIAEGDHGHLLTLLHQHKQLREFCAVIFYPVDVKLE